MSMCLHFLLVHLLKLSAARTRYAKQTSFDMFHSQGAIHIPSMYKQSDSSLCRVWQVSSEDGARIPGVKTGVLQLTSMGQNLLHPHTHTHTEKKALKVLTLLSNPSSNVFTTHSQNDAGGTQKNGTVCVSIPTFCHQKRMIEKQTSYDVTARTSPVITAHSQCTNICR